ncbi:Class-I pyridoxal-phosphate-dependent aminotransferase-like protein [Abortiporus biennis]
MNIAMTMSKPDLRHHLSSEVLSRKENPMKVVQRLSMRNSNMISLANGDPHFSLYPIRKVKFEVAPVSDEVEDPFMSWQNPNSPSISFSSSRSDISSKSLSSESIPLNAALQYHGGTGSDVFVHAMEELTNYYHNPPNHKCLNTLGNMDGIVKCFRLLANPGDNILADEFAFGPPTNAALSQGINWVPVRIDKGGLIPSDLEKVLSDWDEETKGRKPRVLYTVPCGQNPTGCTLNLQRRKEIYAIACKYDLVIIEDDPYYFLQYSDSDGDAVPSNLMPSFVSMDTEGRVIRVESCSKTIAPGMRLGWVVCSPMFYEHMLHLVESSAQFSHGFGQIFLSEMILGPQGWGVLGFDRWVQSLRKEYQRRRDHFQVIFDHEVASTGYASAEAPEAGMFLWIRIHLDEHPRFKLLPSRTADSKNGLIQGVPTIYGRKTNFLELMDEFFENCLNAGVVLTPSSVFALPYESSLFNTDDPLEDRINYVRATFAGPYETMEPGLKIVGQVLRDFFSSNE